MHGTWHRYNVFTHVCSRPFFCLRVWQLRELQLRFCLLVPIAHLKGNTQLFSTLKDKCSLISERKKLCLSHSGDGHCIADVIRRGLCSPCRSWEQRSAQPPGDGAQNGLLLFERHYSTPCRPIPSPILHLIRSTASTPCCKRCWISNV